MKRDRPFTHLVVLLIHAASSQKYSDFINPSNPNAGCAAVKICNQVHKPEPYTTGFSCTDKGPCTEGSGWWRNNGQICTPQCDLETHQPTFAELECIGGTLHPVAIRDYYWEEN